MNNTNDSNNKVSIFNFHPSNQGQSSSTTEQPPDPNSFDFAKDPDGLYSIGQARKTRPKSYGFGDYKIDTSTPEYYKVNVKPEAKGPAPQAEVNNHAPQAKAVATNDMSYAKAENGLYTIGMAKANRPEDFPDDAYEVQRRSKRETGGDETGPRRTVAGKKPRSANPPETTSARPATPPGSEPDLMDGQYTYPKYDYPAYTSQLESTPPYTPPSDPTPTPPPTQVEYMDFQDTLPPTRAEYMDFQDAPPPSQAEYMDFQDAPPTQAEYMGFQDTPLPTVDTHMDPMDHGSVSYQSSTFFLPSFSAQQNNPTNVESYVQTPQTNTSALNQPTSSAAPAFGFQASTSTAAPSNPFANISRPTTSSTSTPSISFGAKPADSTSQTSAFGGFGASATPASKPAEEVSYPKLNGATSSQSDSPAPSPAPKAPTFDFAKPSQKPASNGLGSSMFDKPAEQSAPFKGFGASAASAPKQDATTAPASTFKSSTALKQDVAPPSASFQFGTPAPSASPAPRQADAPKPDFGASFSAKPPFSPAPQQDSAPKMNFGASFAAAQSATTPTPKFTGFGATAPAQASPAPVSFTAKAPEPPKPSSLVGMTQASAPSIMQSATRQQTSSDAPSSGPAKNRELNEALRAYLSSCSSEQDWSHIMRYFLAEHSRISGDARVSSIPDPVSRPTTSHGIPTPSGSVQAQAPAPMGSSTMNKRKAEDEATREDISKRSKANTELSQSTSSPSKPFSQTASLFNDILNTPPKKDAPQQVPATAPAAPSFGGFNPAPPPPKVAAPPAETPKANPFAKLTKVTNTPAAPPSQPPKPTTGGFQFKAPSADPAKAAASPAASPFKINPPTASTTSTTPAAPTFQIPKFGGGGSGAPSFLTSFGSRAAEEEKKAKQERKEEDMDSDEDEEEWEKRDAEEQAAKRKKLLEASQTAGFSFKPATATTKSPAVFSFGSQKQASIPPPAAASNIFGHLSGSQNEKDNEDEESDEDEEADASKSAATSSGSLFDRVEKPSNNDKAGNTGFKFSSATSNGNGASATSPAGDNTWKGVENTPIKFGGLAKPTDSGSTTPEGSPAKKAFGGFSTTDNSKSTPKFGGFTASSVHDKPATAPKFNIFGGSKPAEKPTPASPAASNLNSSVFAPAAKTTGFSFGGPNASASLSAPVAAGSSTSSVFGNSTATSRATTPAGTNTDAETSGKEADTSEPSDEPSAPQNDLTALSAEQLAENDIVFESKARAQQFLKSAGDSDAKPAWQSRGIGMFRILKNKETGKCSVLMRMIPGGRVLLNFSLLPKQTLGGTAYVVMGKMCRMAVPDEQGRMETWAAQFGTVDKVNEVVDKLIAGQPED